MTRTDGPHFYNTPAFKRAQAKWYKQLASEGFYDIESGLDSPPLLKPHHRPLNTVQALSGRPMQTAEDDTRGSEWEELLSDQDRNAVIRETGKGRYAHLSALIAAQEYALLRLGTFRKASETRAAWALHSQGVSEREIARFLGVYRHEIEAAVTLMKAAVLSSIDADMEAC